MAKLDPVELERLRESNRLTHLVALPTAEAACALSVRSPLVTKRPAGVSRSREFGPAPLAARESRGYARFPAGNRPCVHLPEFSESGISPVTEKPRNSKSWRSWRGVNSLLTTVAIIVAWVQEENLGDAASK